MSNLFESQQLDAEHQEKLHGLILASDPTAFSRICEIALPHLTAFLSRNFPQHEIHLIESVAIDTLLDYRKAATQFDPERLSLFSYLQMAAYRNMQNAIDKQRRHLNHLADLVEADYKVFSSDTPESHSELQEWLGDQTSLNFKDILDRIKQELDELDQSILILILSGVRDTEQFSHLLGIEHLDIRTQRQEVKRVKDRIKKYLKRLGDSIRDLDSE